MKHLIGFSGGIDSQKCALWVRERYPAEDIILVNSNAGGNEHPITTQFVAEYSATVFPVVSLQPIVADMWKTPNWAETHYWMWSGEPLTFELMAKIKGRFPSRKAQFCTEKLKINPLLRWVKANLAEKEFVRYSGVRRDESEARSDTPEHGWDNLLDCAFHNPLVDLPKQVCFDDVRTAGEPINPLYSLGFERVGCAPCVNAGKEDISSWAIRAPEMIAKVREWEHFTNRTFFAPCVPGIKPRLSPQGKVEIFNWVDEVVEWAKTDRGGYQFNILKGLHRPSCESRYGLCE
jgi:3'-phosphoadenosine 5'-phosphosulfate sulfotransferase (PAPS reductase)/FAD synthetase